MRKLLSHLRRGWKWLGDNSTSLGGLAAIVTVPGIILALATLRHQSAIDSANLTIKFDKQLRSGKSLEVLNAIDAGEKIDGNGDLRAADIDNYLIKYEMLDDMLESKLITYNLAYDAFSYDIEGAYCNKEVGEYIKNAQKENGDQGLYGGFLSLATKLAKSDRTLHSCDAHPELTH